MPRLLGIDIPGDKRIEAALPYIYGIGPSRAKLVLEQAEISPDVRAKSLTDQQLNRIIQVIQENKYIIEGDLRRELQQNLKRLQAINCYPRHPSSPRTARARPAHQHQRPHPQGPRARRWASSATRTQKPVRPKTGTPPWSNLKPDDHARRHSQLSRP